MKGQNPYRVFAWHAESKRKKVKAPKKKATVKVRAVKIKKVKIDKAKLAIKVPKKKSNSIPNWHKIRSYILHRDGFACRICLETFNLEVHHIDSNRSNNKETNLVSLCGPCHRAVHRENYKPWEHDLPPPWGYLGDD